MYLSILTNRNCNYLKYLEMAVLSPSLMIQMFLIIKVDSRVKKIKTWKKPIQINLWTSQRGNPKLTLTSHYKINRKSKEIWIIAVII